MLRLLIIQPLICAKMVIKTKKLHPKINLAARESVEYEKIIGFNSNIIDANQYDWTLIYLEKGEFVEMSESERGED